MNALREKLSARYVNSSWSSRIISLIKWWNVTRVRKNKFYNFLWINLRWWSKKSINWRRRINCWRKLRL